MLKKGAFVRIKPEYWTNYKNTMEFFSHKPFYPNVAMGMVIRVEKNGACLVSWMPFGMYPIPDGRYAIDAEFLEVVQHE